MAAVADEFLQPSHVFNWRSAASGDQAHEPKYQEAQQVKHI
jgi:hypothetical protein